MQLLLIQQTPEENEAFINNPLCVDSIYVCIDFYKRVGFNPPWLCYYAEDDGNLVGGAGFKGKPVNNTVEISYGTFEPYQRQGMATKMCRLLVQTALQADPNIIITARTVPENNYSTRVLEKNGFVLTGTVNDPEDGDVWEWRYIAGSWA